MARYTTWLSGELLHSRYPLSTTLIDTSCSGANIGGSDGVDVWGDNYWVHDVEVTNRDECVTVKVLTTPYVMLVHADTDTC